MLSRKVNYKVFPTTADEKDCTRCPPGWPAPFVLLVLFKLEVSTYIRTVPQKKEDRENFSLRTRFDGIRGRYAAIEGILLGPHESLFNAKFQHSTEILLWFHNIILIRHPWTITTSPSPPPSSSLEPGGIIILLFFHVKVEAITS